MRGVALLFISSGRGSVSVSFLAVLLLIGSQVWSQPLAILTELQPRTQIRLPNGEMGGPNVEVVREIQRRVGNSDPIKEVAWARGYHELSTTPNTLLFTVARTAQRNALFHWVGPINENVYGLYVKADSTLRLKNLEDAKALKLISVYRNDVRDQFLTQAGFTNLDRTSDEAANVKMLMAGRVQAIASSSSTIDDQMARAGVPREHVSLALPFVTAQTWLAFSKGATEKTIADWTQALESMKKDKSFEKIMKSGNPKWSPPTKPITEF